MGTIEVAVDVSAEPSSEQLEATSWQRRAAAGGAGLLGDRSRRALGVEQTRARARPGRAAPRRDQRLRRRSISAMPLPVSCTGSPRPSATAASRRRAIALDPARGKARRQRREQRDKAKPPKTSIECQNATADRLRHAERDRPARRLMRAIAVLTPPLDGRGLPESFVAALQRRHQRCSESPGSAEQLLVSASGDPEVVGVEHRGGPHGGTRWRLTTATIASA